MYYDDIAQNEIEYMFLYIYMFVQFSSNTLLFLCYAKLAYIFKLRFMFELLSQVVRAKERLEEEIHLQNQETENHTKKKEGTD